jgi:hypothetical protein
MNHGIQDAFNLAWKLSLVLRNGSDPRLLDSYEAERKPVDEAVIRQTDRATRLVSLHGSVTRFVRDHLMSLLTRIPMVQEKLGEGLSGIVVNYRHSPIVEEHASGLHGPSAGDRAPRRTAHQSEWPGARATLRALCRTSPYSSSVGQRKRLAGSLARPPR